MIIGDRLPELCEQKNLSPGDIGHRTDLRATCNLFEPRS
jgi:hypothetical protein